MGEVEGEGMLIRWELAKLVGVETSGELPEPEEEEEIEAERLRKFAEGLILIGSECLADLFWSILLMFDEAIAIDEKAWNI
jgi:hypothetical protein